MSEKPIGLGKEAEELKEYFDLSVKNEDLYSAGGVEKGYTHGIEIIDGEFYATLYHIQKSISKGKLKEFLQQFENTEMLKKLGINLSKAYQFKTIKVKYTNYRNEIEKYPFSAILAYFYNNNSSDSKTHLEIKENQSEIEQNSAGKPIRLGKAAGELNIGISTLVEILASKGIDVSSNPNTKLESSHFEILKNELVPSDKIKVVAKKTFHRLGDSALDFKIGISEIVDFLLKNNEEIVVNENTILTNHQYKLLTEEFKNKKGQNKLSLQFKNFRRFENFPELELGNITYLVGKNNAGKSTLVKALMLMLDYLQNQTNDQFSFAKGILNDVNIVTYGRAKTNLNEEPFVQFELKIRDANVTVNFSGDNDATEANVNWFQIVMPNATLKIDFLEKYVSIKKLKEKSSDLTSVDSNVLKELKREIRILRNQLEHGLNLDLKSRVNLNNRVERLEKSIQLSKSNQPKEEIITDIIQFGTHFDDFTENLHSISIEDVIGILYVKMDLARFGFFDDKKKYSLEERARMLLNNENASALFKDKGLKLEFENFFKQIQKEILFYLGANPSKQTALFLIRDKGNALAQAIHEFTQLRIDKTDEESKFVRFWMNEFEIGFNYRIKFYAGEAYEFYVIDEKKNEIQLSDKGMGSLQAMMLILRVASLIRLKKKNDQVFTIIVEEPELNLHPALQSKLTDFFFEVNQKYGFRFIIETHSEYMIRKSQLIGVEKNLFGDNSLNKNPFKVYYFDSENGPYEMKYTAEGRFDKDFGEGFYDVSAKLMRESLKNISKRI